MNKQEMITILSDCVKSNMGCIKNYKSQIIILKKSRSSESKFHIKSMNDLIAFAQDNIREYLLLIKQYKNE